MKPTTLRLALVNLLTATISASPPTPGQTFYLKVIGGNTLTSTAVLRGNNTYDLGVTPPPYYNDDGGYGDYPLPISMSTSNTSSLFVLPTNPHPSPGAGRLVLVSAGPGDWTLSKAYSANPDGPWNVGPGRDGATVKVYGWESRDAVWGGGGSVLRWGDETCSGRWAAVKTKGVPMEGGAPFDRWVIHWFEVTPGNMGALGEFVLVDLEVSSTP